MDKKLLDALNNVSEAIMLLSETLESKQEAKSSTAQALKSTDIGKQLKSLDIGIKNLQKDTKEILKNQRTIMDMSSNKSDKSDSIADIGSDPKKKKSIKDGVSIILLIATGVIAIGIAFKLIGNVDFASVIALSVSLPLVALAFEKISQMKDLKPKEILSLIMVTVGIATAIMLTSYILRMVQPVGLFQLFTSIMISAVFGGISFGIGKLIQGLSNSKITLSQLAKVSIFLPIAMIAVSLAIAGSSYALRMVQPVGLFQLFTSIFIAATFSVIAFGIGKLIQGISQLKDPAQATKLAITLPIMLVAISAAIALSSLVLSQIQPIGLFQFFTAVMISLVFIPISFAIPYLAKAMESIDVKKVALIPIMIVAIAATIWLSSLIFAQIPAEKITFGLLFKVLLISIALGAVATGMGFVITTLDKFKIDIPKAIKGSLVLLIIATTVMITSHILSLGDYSKFPGFNWVLPVTLALVAFGLVTATLGFIATTGIGAVALVAGAVSILLVAGSIVATAEILSTGNYGKFPSFEWSSSVALSLAAFGAGILLLGSFVVGTLGLGGLAIVAGAEAVKIVSQSIVDSSIILQGGMYTGGPKKEWAESIAIALGAFSPIYGMLMRNSIFELFGGGGVGPDDFKTAIVTISEGIVEAASKFNSSKVLFQGGPKKEWAEGIGQAIGAFAPVYAVLAENSGFFSSGPSVEDMTKAIDTISRGIVSVAKFFGENSAVFDPNKAPSKEWSEGIGGAIKVFAPVFDFISENTGFFTSSDDVIESMQRGITSIAQSIVDVSNIINAGKFSSRIDPGFIKNVSDGIKQYVSIIDYLSDKDVDDFDILEDYADGLVQIADAYDKFADSISKLNSSLSNLDLEKIGALKTLTGGIILMSLMDSDQFEDMMDALEDKAEIFIETVNKLEGSKPGDIQKPSVSGGASGAKPSEVSVKPKTEDTTLKDILTTLTSIQNTLGSIATDASSIQDYVVEKNDRTMIGSVKT